jgi:hypothetical protein
MNKYIIIFSCLFLSIISYAQCISGNCNNGKGVYLIPNGAKYTGKFKDKLFQGKGVMLFIDGNQYDGQWQNSLPNGYGVMNYSDGSIRNGFWQNGVPMKTDANVDYDMYEKFKFETLHGCISGNCKNGEGQYIFSNGTEYNGKFANSQPSGKGKMKYTDGNTFVGEFEKGLPHGIGRMSYLDGAYQYGTWTSGEYQNEFALKGAMGCVEGDCQSGRGVYLFSIGKYDVKYEGEMKNGLPNGFGSAEYTNGEKYIGDWLDGKHNGQGSLVLVNGSRIEGTWKSGLYNGKIKSQSDNTNSTFVKYEPYDISSYTPKSSSIINVDSFLKVKTKQNSKTYVIIVGISSYTHMPTLKYADDDAWKMYGFFKNNSFKPIDERDMVLLIDDQATRENIISQVSEINKKTNKDDRLIMYFSGHGLEDALLPYDYDGYKNKVFHNELNEIFSKSKAKVKVLFSDACYSGNISANIAKLKPSEYEGFVKSGTTLILSSNNKENALESNTLRQGVYSHFLLRGIEGEADTNQDRAVTIDELYQFIRNNVKDYTDSRQTPVLRGNFDPYTVISVIRK